MLDFASLLEEHLISFIRRDDLQIDKIWNHVLKWGLAMLPATWSGDDHGNKFTKLFTSN